MQFLRARRDVHTAAWWAAAAAAPDAPMIVTEMLRDDSVVCDRGELEGALDWARRQPGWTDARPALSVHEPHAEIT